MTETTSTKKDKLIELTGQLESHASSMKTAITEAEYQLKHAKSCADLCLNMGNEVINLAIEIDD